MCLCDKRKIVHIRIIELTSLSHLQLPPPPFSNQARAQLCKTLDASWHHWNDWNFLPDVRVRIATKPKSLVA